mmetsp:Transcript_65564/g.102361  ORF Transcript_65564/g.102361 Transcript_65564/m.102361 type:complete len:1134 (+) Transcript_65564:76-3477(+)
MQWFAGLVGGLAPEPPQTMPKCHSESYAVGEMIEYFSSSTQTWIVAKVLGINQSGTYNLDCKPDVSAEKIRRRQSSGGGGLISLGGNNNSDGAKYAVGDMVEYNSSAHGWITAKVLGVTQKGTYNLDCKPDVQREKIRPKHVDTATFDPVTRTNNQIERQGSRVSFGEGGFKPESSIQTAAMYERKRPVVVEPPVQLLRIQQGGQRGWYFELCPEGAQRLERYGSRRISIISVCGLPRSGKSYLLHLLTEQLQERPSFSRNGTDGLWLFGVVNEDDSSPLIAFLDCESLVSDVKSGCLLTLCGLLSSVLILNTKGALNDSLFKALGTSCRFADHAELGPGVPRSSNAALLWLLRDFSMDLRDSTGRLMTPDEYMEQALLSAQHDQSPGSNLRQNLRGFFSRQSCAMLTRPVVDESQTQQLMNLPYSSLTSQFRTGAEALRTQLLATCRASAKSVGGTPLGCVAFVALLRQLLDSLNNQQPLNLKNSWETVQHGHCGSLMDQLRAMAMVTCRTLQAGEALQGGAQLPLSDESLRMVLRQQRHDLKAQWEANSIGDEVVRKEYWQELKESFARDEKMVGQQNAKLADQRLKEVLQKWQHFLDDDYSDGGSADAAERIATELSMIMERVPTIPLAKTAKVAMETAGRRIAAVRAELRAGGNGATLRSSATYNPAMEAELRETKAELQSQKFQLQEAKAELERLFASPNTNTSSKEFAEKEAAWRAELEHCHVAAAKAEADHLHSERVLKTELKQLSERESILREELEQLREGQLNPELAENVQKERAERLRLEDELRRLEMEMENVRGQASSHRGSAEAELQAIRATHEAERRSLEIELERVRSQCASQGQIEEELEILRASQTAERTRLERELDVARNHASNKNQLEANLQAQNSSQAAERAELERELENARGQAAERSRIEAELERLRVTQARERQRLEAELEEAREQAAQKTRLEAELEQARKQAAEQSQLQSELERMRAQAEEYKQKLTKETSSLKTENEKTTAEYMRMVDDARRRLEEERKEHADKLGGERDRLLERERNAGVLEGRVHAISAEATTLRDRVTELQNKVSEAEGMKGKHMEEKDGMRQDLILARAQMNAAQTEMKRLKEEYERRLQEANSKTQQPKCCIVQ